MPSRPKKGKARVQAAAPEEVGELAPIPEDPTGYEGYGNYGQGGETWQNDGTAWADGGAYGDGYAQGEDQWGQQPGPQTEAWDTGQYQQGWGPPPTFPVNPPPPAGPAAFAEWGRPQDLPNAPPPPHGPPPPPHQLSGAPPPATQPSHPGAAAGVPSWQKWGAEAMAYSKHYPPPPPQGPGPAYDQPNRVAFASQNSYVSFGDRAQDTPQAQRMMFDSIMNSRGGPPKQPQQRAAKQSRKKREKRQQEQNAPNGWAGQQENPAWDQNNSGWEQDNSGWKQDNQQWDQGGYGWDQGGGEWKEKQDIGPWASGAPGRDDLDSQGYTDSEGWNDVTGRRNFRRTVSNAFVPAPTGDSPYPMPSRTMAYANDTAQDPLDAYYPGYSRKGNTMHDYANISFPESYGEALKPVENALFGRDRKARERIHWQFPHNKDERVRHTLEWLHDNTHGVGAFGLNKFLQTRERGALFINASYDDPSGGGPALDWLAYEDVVGTHDRLLQESVGFYDPAMQVVVFVFLPSKSGNSLAMWRRKVAVPNNVRLAHLREIELAKAALRKDYPVFIDEMRSPPYRSSSLQTHSTPPSTKKKKKGFFRRLFRIFKIVW